MATGYPIATQASCLSGAPPNTTTLTGGTDQAIHDPLRRQARDKSDRSADPRPVVLDTQSLHAAAGVPADTTECDASKKAPGRKRGLTVDVLGLVIAVVVLATSVHDAGFVPQPKKWVVAQTNRVLVPHRRLARDYEHRSAAAESRVYWAIGDRMSKILHRGLRLARRMTGGEPTLGALLVRAGRSEGRDAGEGETNACDQDRAGGGESPVGAQRFRAGRRRVVAAGR